MTLERVTPDDLDPTAPYAYATIVGPGSLVFTAGACPLDRHGSVVHPGDLAAQARVVMSNLGATLAAAGCSLADVAKSTVFVASGRREDLVAAWQEVRDGFGDSDPPSTLLGVTVLGYPDQLVEVEVVAVRPLVSSHD